MDSTMQSGGIQRSQRSESSHYLLCDQGSASGPVGSRSRVNLSSAQYLLSGGFFNTIQFRRSIDFITLTAPLSAGDTLALGYAPPGEQVSIYSAADNTLLGSGQTNAAGAYRID